MSSDIFNYSEAEKAGLFGQFASAMKIAQEQQRPYDTIKQSLQAIISDDSVVRITPKVIADAADGKVLDLVGNFDSAVEAIGAGKYDYHYGYADGNKQIAKIPMIVQPIDRKVRIAPPLGRKVTTDEMFDLYPKMADPMTLFTLGAKFPKEQLDGPIFVVWKDHAGQFWCAILDGGGTGRRVVVGQDDPDGKWGDDCRPLLCE